MISRNLQIAGIVAITLAVFFGCVLVAVGAVDFRVQTNNVNEIQGLTFFNATTTTATSTTGGNLGLNIAGAKKVELKFARGGATGPNLGQSLFKVQVSMDGGNTWDEFSRLLLSTSTSQTGVATVQLSGTSSSMVAVDLRTDTFTNLRCVVNEVTDGEHTCSGIAEFGK